MSPSERLKALHVASPCQASWAEMTGDDRRRFCERCSQHVYNLSAMTAAEGLALVQQAEGRACLRFYRREDGTILTADCPIGIRAAIRQRLLRVAGAAVAAFLMARLTLGAVTDVLSPEGKGRVPGPRRIFTLGPRPTNQVMPNPQGFQPTMGMGMLMIPPGSAVEGGDPVPGECPPEPPLSPPG